MSPSPSLLFGSPRGRLEREIDSGSCPARQQHRPSVLERGVQGLRLALGVDRLDLRAARAQRNDAAEHQEAGRARPGSGNEQIEHGLAVAVPDVLLQLRPLLPRHVACEELREARIDARLRLAVVNVAEAAEAQPPRAPLVLIPRVPAEARHVAGIGACALAASPALKVQRGYGVPAEAVFAVAAPMFAVRRPAGLGARSDQARPNGPVVEGELPAAPKGASL